MKIELTGVFTMPAGTEVDYCVEVEMDGWSTPARLSGPPECCYEADGECEVLGATLTEAWVGETDLLATLSPAERVVLTDKILEDADERLEELFYEALADARHRAH